MTVCVLSATIADVALRSGRAELTQEANRRALLLKTTTDFIPVAVTNHYLESDELSTHIGAIRRLNECDRTAGWTVYTVHFAEVLKREVRPTGYSQPARFRRTEVGRQPRVFLTKLTTSCAHVS